MRMCVPPPPPPPPHSEREWRTVSGYVGGATSATGSAPTPPAPAPSTSPPARAWPACLKRPVKEGMSWVGVLFVVVLFLRFGVYIVFLVTPSHILYYIMYMMDEP